jgi:hypothetical protein
MPIHPEVSLDWLVSNTSGYSGAEVFLTITTIFLHIQSKHYGLHKNFLYR